MFTFGKIFMNMQKVLIVLGRFGDIYMTLSRMKEPCILACYPEFSQIVSDLFPQHGVYEIPSGLDKRNAIEFCRLKFPEAIIEWAQQNGCGLEEYVGFRNYQSYQIFHANKLQESNHIPERGQLQD